MRGYVSADGACGECSIDVKGEINIVMKKPSLWAFFVVDMFRVVSTGMVF